MIIQTLTIKDIDEDPCVLWVVESPYPVVTTEDDPFPVSLFVGQQIDFYGDGRRVFRSVT